MARDLHVHFNSVKENAVVVSTSGFGGTVEPVRIEGDTVGMEASMGQRSINLAFLAAKLVSLIGIRKSTNEGLPIAWREPGTKQWLDSFHNIRRTWSSNAYHSHVRMFGENLFEGKGLSAWLFGMPNGKRSNRRLELFYRQNPDLIKIWVPFRDFELQWPKQSGAKVVEGFVEVTNPVILFEFFELLVAGGYKPGGKTKEKWAKWDWDPALFDAVERLRANPPSTGGPRLNDVTESDDFSNDPSFEIDSGPMRPDSQFYVERKEDRLLLSYLSNCGTALIRGAPKTGKTSMARRVGAQLERAGWVAVFVDVLVEFDPSDLDDSRSLLTKVARKVLNHCGGRPDLLEMLAEPDLDPQPAFLSFFDALKRFRPEVRILLILDRIDNLRDRKGNAGFLNGFRNLFQNGQISYDRKWLALLMTDTLKPQIKSRNQSPFWAGKVLSLPDFTKSELGKLATRYNLSKKFVSSLDSILGGHPFLCRHLLNECAMRNLSPDDVYGEIFDSDENIFHEHLREIAAIIDASNLEPAFQELISGDSQRKELVRETYERLISVGVAVDSSLKNAAVRNELYRRLLPNHL